MKNLLFLLLVLGGSVWLLLSWSSSAPGDSHAGPLPALDGEQQESAERLRSLCESLAQDIGPRGTHAPSAQDDALELIRRELRRARLDASEFELECNGSISKAIEVVIPGRALARESIVLCAHYDTRAGSPGADENASGVALLVELARLLGHSGYDRTLRFVFWGQGAAPLAGSEKSGAWAYARRLHSRKEQAALVLALDTVGVYKTAAGSQSLPFPLGFFYPDRGDFVAFVSDIGSRSALERTVGEFRRVAKFPSQALSLPSCFGLISDSDDGSFRAQGFQAVRVTDTGRLRNPSAGTPGDRSSTLDCERMARVAHGLAATVAALAKRTTPLL